MTRTGKVLLALGGAVVLALGAFAFLVATAFSGSDGPPSTDMQSGSLPDDAARLAFAEKYIDFASPVQATAFRIVYHNNSPMGPSDWDMTIVVKVSPADVARWSDGPLVLAPFELRACPSVAGSDARLSTTSTPAVHGSKRCFRALYATEGVVCVSCTTL